MRPAGRPPAPSIIRRPTQSRRRWRIVLAALTLSILLHLMLLKSWRIPVPHWPLPALPLQVRLTNPYISHPAANHLTVAHSAQLSKRQPTTIRHRPLPARHTLLTPKRSALRLPVNLNPTATPVVPAPTPVISPIPGTTRSAKSDKLPISSIPPAGDIHGLPKNLLLQYHIYLGEGGMNIGHASYAWIQDDSRYTLASIVQADGLLALFQSGRITQISTGHISQGHLLPDDFEIQRGSDSPNTTTHLHINHTTQLATVTRHGNTTTEPVPDGAQDILSIIFELALRAPFANTITLPVSSGKAFKPYHATNVGEETITTPLGKLQTLHITRPPEDGEDGMDIWLDENRHYLPVKIRLHDGQLGWIVQVATSVSFDTPQKITP